jgi:hypothetical protein
MGVITEFQAAYHNKSLLCIAIRKELHWFLLRFWITQTSLSVDANLEGHLFDKRDSDRESGWI